MNENAKPISDLRRRLLEDMAVRRLGEKTQHDYVRHIEAFARFLGRSPATASAEDRRAFQVHMVGEGPKPPKMAAQVSALRFFLKVTCGRLDLAHSLARLDYPRKLPRVPPSHPALRPAGASQDQGRDPGTRPRADRGGDAGASSTAADEAGSGHHQHRGAGQADPSLPVLRRADDHHRDARCRHDAAQQADDDAGRDQDRHTMTPPLAVSPDITARMLRWLTAGNDGAWPRHPSAPHSGARSPAIRLVSMMAGLPVCRKQPANRCPGSLDSPALDRRCQRNPHSAR